jgi:hypothetical protein
VITIPAEPAPAEKLPPLLRGFGALLPFTSAGMITHFSP